MSTRGRASRTRRARTGAASTVTTVSTKAKSTEPRSSPTAEQLRTSLSSSPTWSERFARKRAGKRAQAHGAAFETWLEASHITARTYGYVVWIEKIPTPTRMVRTKTGWQAVFTKAQELVDFVGLLPNGRMLVVEAKSKIGRLSRTEVQPHQQRLLALCERAGGVALLAVELDHRRFAVPWGKVPWQTLRTAETIGAEDLEGWEAGSCYLGANERGAWPLKDSYALQDV
jgi:Holliday junction resolvase